MIIDPVRLTDRRRLLQSISQTLTPPKPKKETERKEEEKK